MSCKYPGKPPGDGLQVMGVYACYGLTVSPRVHVLEFPSAAVLRGRISRRWLDRERSVLLSRLMNAIIIMLLLQKGLCYFEWICYKSKFVPSFTGSLSSTYVHAGTTHTHNFCLPLWGTKQRRPSPLDAALHS